MPQVVPLSRRSSRLGLRTGISFDIDADYSLAGKAYRFAWYKQGKLIFELDENSPDVTVLGQVITANLDSSTENAIAGDDLPVSWSDLPFFYGTNSYVFLFEIGPDGDDVDFGATARWQHYPDYYEGPIGDLAMEAGSFLIGDTVYSITVNNEFAAAFAAAQSAAIALAAQQAAEIAAATLDLPALNGPARSLQILRANLAGTAWELVSPDNAIATLTPQVSGNLSAPATPTFTILNAPANVARVEWLFLSGGLPIAIATEPGAGSLWTATPTTHFDPLPAGTHPLQVRVFFANGLLLSFWKNVVVV